MERNTKLEIESGPVILVNIVNVSEMEKEFVSSRIAHLHNLVANLLRDFAALLNVQN